MTIREVLDADWNVDKIDVTVRDEITTKYIMGYCIGKDVSAGRSERFLYETECGDMYINSSMKKLYMNRIIQYRQLPKKPKGKEALVGVLTSEIPAEILDLPVWYMRPFDCGKSSEMHGYRFECYVGFWNGIRGEEKQLELDLLN